MSSVAKGKEKRLRLERGALLDEEGDSGRAVGSDGTVQGRGGGLVEQAGTRPIL